MTTEKKMEWTVHHIVEDPHKGIFAVTVILLISLIVHFSFNETYYTVLSLVLLVGSLSKFFFPVTYTFTDTQVRVRGLIFPLERPWSEFRRIDRFRDGVSLSPFVRPSRLDHYRAVFIRFKDNRDDVLAFLAGKIEKNADREN